MIEVKAVKEVLNDKALKNAIYKKPAKDLKVKYLADIEPLEIYENGDWIDLRCAKDTLIFKGQYKAIPLGIAIELPKGYEALIIPRSSTFKRFGVLPANGMGLIDESYCGDGDEWHFLVYGTKETLIEKNERICQFRIIKHQPGINLIEVDVLGNPDRKGIGSTN